MTKLQELEANKAKLMADAEVLEAKSRSKEINDEEVLAYDKVLADLEATDKELEVERKSERLASVKARAAEPIREIVSAHQRGSTGGNAGNYEEYAEAFKSWVASQGDTDADLSPAAHHRARKYGFNLGNKSAKVRANWNLKSRAVMSIGADPGIQLAYQTYSDKVVEYLKYHSPFVSRLATETNADGNARTYMRIDPSAMIASYVGGTEVAPTFSQANMVPSQVVIGTKTATSSDQVFTRQSLRDSGVSLLDKAAAANGISFASFIEDRVLNASGDGSPDVQGLVSVATDLTESETEWSLAVFKKLYWGCPMAYRKNLIFVGNSSDFGDMEEALQDQIDRSYFNFSAADSPEFATVLSKPFFPSDFCPAGTLLAFVPDFYMLRLVEGQEFNSLPWKNYPSTTLNGLMDFGGAWIGPAAAVNKVVLEA